MAEQLCHSCGKAVLDTTSHCHHGQRIIAQALLAKACHFPYQMQIASEASEWSRLTIDTSLNFGFNTGTGNPAGLGGRAILILAQNM